MQIYDIALRVGTQLRRSHFATDIYSFRLFLWTLYAHPEMRLDFCVGVAAFQVYRRQNIKPLSRCASGPPTPPFRLPPASQRGRCPGLASGT